MPNDQQWLDEESPALTPEQIETTKQTAESLSKLQADVAALDPRTRRVQCNALVDDSHKYTNVMSSGADGPTYAILTKDGREVHRLTFHEGPLAGEKACDVKGVMIENLLAIVIDRLKTHQASKYACEENQNALEHTKMAVFALKMRTSKREERKVEGTHEI